MGVVLDTSILIAAERGGFSIEQALLPVRARDAEAVAISAITVAELTHGIHRARGAADCEQRTHFASECYRILPVYPVTFAIAEIAGEVEAGLASRGTPIDFEDVVIGATALYLGYSVVTFNLRHFKQIPGLNVYPPESIS